MILTGLFFVFYQPMLRGLAVATHTSPATIATWYANPTPPPHPATTPQLSINEAFHRATAALPPGLTVSYLAVPSTHSSAIEAIAYYPHTAAYAQPFRVFLDPVTERHARPP